MMAREQSQAAYKLPAGAENVSSEPLTLDETFRRYAPYVARIGLRLLGRDDEVDDLVQDVFLAAHRGLEGLRDPGAVKGWLATVTVRTAKRRLRARRLRRFLHLDAETEYVQIADSRASPEQRALLASIYRILDGVPVDQRLAWSLRMIQGERLERVAELCGCSLATAKRRIKAAQEAIEGGIRRG